MTSPASSSSPGADSTQAFERLHPKVQEWIWNQGWQQLRPVQARSVAPVIAGDRDVIITAATAGGKTEAAWLPICSALAFDADAGKASPGAKALAISPLKALINDQYDRLRDIGELADIPVYRRHGDVTGKERTDFIRQPDGVILITPESLEALFVNQGSQVPKLLQGLRYVVVDELHSFIGSERGAQLQSLLHRVELAIRRRIPRIALSATIADTAIAAGFLRPGGGSNVVVIEDRSQRSEIQMILRGHVATPEPAPTVATDAEPSPAGDGEGDADDGEASAARQIAENIYKHMRGKDNLVFANSRSCVEFYTDVLTRMCEDLRVPNEFYAHHGNLSKEHREDVERKLKSKETAATAVCTSTLEMGIDIGSADAVGQIGAPASVSALRQRLGRSGRRGGPAVLRMYVTESALRADTSSVDQLRMQTVQAIAVIELLLERWYEPPNVASLHLSTLIQQVLSVIAQHGGASAPQLFSALCAEGPFVRVTKEMFLRLLRDMGSHDLISQASDGTLLPGRAGEKLLSHFSFYAAFATEPEYRLEAQGRALGTMPILMPLQVGSFLVFGGRRWKILDVDDQARVVQLASAKGGRPPMFLGGGAEIADGIRQKMRALYGQTNVPTYLNATAQTLLGEGRSAFQRLGLEQAPVLPQGRGSILFPWRGDRILNTIAVVLKREGVDAEGHSAAIHCPNTDPERLHSLLMKLSASPEPDADSLAASVLNKAQDKHDRFLSEPLLTAAYAARSLDVPGTWGALRDLARFDARPRVD